MFHALCRSYTFRLTRHCRQVDGNTKSVICDLKAIDTKFWRGINIQLEAAIYFEKEPCFSRFSVLWKEIYNLARCLRFSKQMLKHELSCEAK